MDSIKITSASINNAKKAGSLLYETMGWVEDLLKFKDQKQTEEFLSDLFKLEDHSFSYQNSKIAKFDGKNVGLLISYPGELSTRLGIKTAFKYWNMKEYFTFARFIKILWNSIKFEKADKKEYYISNIAVDEDYRRLGIAEKLLLTAENLAKKNGSQRISLLVKVDNDVAKNLYYKFNYKIVNVFKFTGFKVCKMIKRID